MRYALVDGTRTLAAPKLRGFCPGCRGEVIAKCGEIIRWHWDLEEQARRDEAARISAEKLRQEIEKQRAEQERIEKERIVALRSVSLLEQSNFLRLENLRMVVCDEIRSPRPVESDTFGKWGTFELVGLRDSLRAAKKRLGEARWAEFVKQGVQR